MRAIVFCTDSLNRLYSLYMLEAFRYLYEYPPQFEGSQAVGCSEISATLVSVSEDFDIYQHLCVNLLYSINIYQRHCENFKSCI